MQYSKLHLKVQQDAQKPACATSLSKIKIFVTKSDQP